MRYDEAKAQIQNGDTIAVMETEGFLSPFTRFFTRSNYTHVGMALWIEGDLWMAEINAGKNHAIPMSQLRGTAFDVYGSPVADTLAVRRSAFDALREKIEYGFAALPVVGLLNWLKIKTFVHARRILECAGFLVMIYEGAGWSEHTRILSPQELTELLKLKCQVRPN